MWNACQKFFRLPSASKRFVLRTILILPIAYSGLELFGLNRLLARIQRLAPNAGQMPEPSLQKIQTYTHLFPPSRPAGGSRYRTRIQTTAQENGDRAPRQPVLNRHPQKTSKILDVVLPFFIVNFRRLLKGPIPGDMELAFSAD